MSCIDDGDDDEGRAKDEFDGALADAMDELMSVSPDISIVREHLIGAFWANDEIGDFDLNGQNERGGFLAEIGRLVDVSLFDDARHRIDLWLHPKFVDVAECQAKYNEAMGVAS